MEVVEEEEEEEEALGAVPTGTHSRVSRSSAWASLRHTAPS
jgi:hypothetical protein